MINIRRVMFGVFLGSLVLVMVGTSYAGGDSIEAKRFILHTLEEDGYSVVVQEKLFSGESEFFYSLVLSRHGRSIAFHFEREYLENFFRVRLEIPRSLDILERCLSIKEIGFKAVLTDFPLKKYEDCHHMQFHVVFGEKMDRVVLDTCYGKACVFCLFEWGFMVSAGETSKIVDIEEYYNEFPLEAEGTRLSIDGNDTIAFKIGNHYHINRGLRSILFDFTAKESKDKWSLGRGWDGFEVVEYDKEKKYLIVRSGKKVFSVSFNSKEIFTIKEFKE